MDVVNPNYLNYMEQIQKNRKDIEKLYDQELSDITQLNFKENEENGLQYANGKAIFQGKSTIIRDANSENLEVNSKVELKISSGDADIVIGAGVDNSTLEIHLDNETKLALDFAESERLKSQTDGAIVHKKDIEPILIYDIDTKNTIDGTAYTSGIKFGASTNINIVGSSKIKIYTRVYNTYNITEVAIDKTGWTGNSFMVFGEASAIKNVGIIIYHAGQSITPAECYNFSDGTGLNNNDNAYVYRIEEV